MEIYDALIIGAGPAGLNAGIYLGRYRRKTLIVDAERGRSTIPGNYSNILGFLEPVDRLNLRKIGSDQVRKYGVEKVCDEVKDIEILEDNLFKILTQEKYYLARNLIFCTGVSDNWSLIAGYENYVGRTLHSCGICAGFECIDKKVAIIGSGKKAINTIIFMLQYTKMLFIVTNGEGPDIEEKYTKKFKEWHIPVYSNKIKKLVGKESNLEWIILDDNTALETDMIISDLGVKVNSDIAKRAGVKVNEHGYIIVNPKQETNIKGIFAAGDVTTFDSKQVVKALYEGFNAASTINATILGEFKTKIQEEK